MKKSLKEWIGYRFDRLFSRGLPALLLLLFLASAAIVATVSLAVWLSGTAPAGKSLPRVLWESLLRTLDPGTMGDDEGPAFFLAMMLTVTLGGIFVVSILIGIITTWMESQLDRLRRGRSPVLERGHTLILGWNRQTLDLVEQLAGHSRTNRSRATIAVLAEKDKVLMEETIGERVSKGDGITIVCRTGEPVSSHDLSMVSAETAASVIVVPPEGSPHPDTEVVKSALALSGLRSDWAHSYTVVAEVESDEASELIPEILDGQNVFVVKRNTVIARLAAQTTASPGLSRVYEDLFDFEGSELYVKSIPELANSSFGEALLEIDGACLLGVADPNGSGVNLLPSFETRITPDSRLVLIAEDTSSGRPFDASELPAIDSDAILRDGWDDRDDPARILVVGWNFSVPALLEELKHYVPKGSHVTVCCPEEYLHEAEDSASTIDDLDVSVVACEATKRGELSRIMETSYECVLVLSRYDVPAEHADAETLLVLLNLRRIQQEHDIDFSLVAELHDSSTRELAEVARPNDFILSDHVLSQLAAQISVQPLLYHVFTDLFDAEGAEFYVREATRYLRPGSTVNFATAIEATRLRGEIAVGYFVGDELALNPPKSTAFEVNDDLRLAVLATH